MRFLQYQVKTEPVSTRSETITPDKWLGSEEVPQSSFKAKVLAAAAIALASSTAFAFTPAPPFPESVSIDRWHPAIEQPRFDRKRNQFTYPSTWLGDVPRAENVTIDRWHPEIEKPRFDRKRNQYLYESNFFTNPQTGEVVYIDKWNPSEEVPRQDRKREQYKYPSLFYADIPRAESVSVDRWYFQGPDPQRRKPQPITESSEFLYPITTTVVVPFDWNIQNQEPQRSRQRLISSGERTVDPFPVVSFGWSPQLSPVFRRVGSREYPYFAFVALVQPSTITPDMWLPADVYMKPPKPAMPWATGVDVIVFSEAPRLPCILIANADLIQPVRYCTTLVQPVQYDATLIQPVDYDSEGSCEL